MKRITSLMLSAVMLLLCLYAPVMAETMKVINNEAMGVLGAIEVIPTEINPDQTVTRADFAVYTARMFGINDFEENGDRYYVDVPMDHYALTAINYLTEKKILSGNGGSYFYPDNTIGIAEACKILVESINYGNYAESFGAYPAGYIYAAQRLNIIDSTKTYSSQLTVAEVSELIFNTMIIQLGESIVEDEYSVWSAAERSLLETYHNVYIAEGIVESANGRAIYEDNIQEADKVAIGRKVIDNGIANETSGLLGDWVTAYYVSSDNGLTGELIYVYPEKAKTKSLTINTKDYYKISDGNLYYYEETREKRIKLDNFYFVAYNGRPFTEESNKKVFENLGNGQISFKDTDRNGGYDVVIIEEAENFLVSFVNVTDETISDMLLTGRNIDLKKYDIVEIVDAEGNTVELKDITEKSVVSAFESYDKKLLKLVVIAKTITGKVESDKTVRGERVITVGGTSYIVTDLAFKKSNATLAVGQNLTYYINSFGQIVYFETAKPGEMSPGYLVAWAVEESAFDKRLLLKIYDGSGKINILPCAEKVVIDTVQHTSIENARKAIPDYDTQGGQVKPQIIAYKTNTKGEITKIDTTAKKGEETADNSLVRNIEFGEIAVSADYRLGLTAILSPTSTVQFLVPDDSVAAEADEDDFSVGNVTLSQLGGYYTKVETYRLRGDNVYEDILVRKDISTKEIGNSSTIMLVEEVCDVVDENGDLTVSISGLMKGAAVSYVVESDCAITDHNDKIEYTINDVSEGDAIRVGEANGKVGAIEIIYDYSKGGLPDWCGKKEGFNWYKTSTDDYYWQRVQISFGYIANRKDGVVEIAYEKGGEVKEVYNKLENIMVYDSEARTDKVYIGNISDIRDAKFYGADNCSRILFQTDQGKYMGVIIYK